MFLNLGLNVSVLPETNRIVKGACGARSIACQPNCQQAPLISINILATYASEPFRELMQDARLGEKAFFLRAKILHGAFDPGASAHPVYDTVRRFDTQFPVNAFSVLN